MGGGRARGAAARGRGGNLANLPRRGRGREGRSGARRGRGRREPEAEAGPPRAARLCGPSGRRGPDWDAERCLPAALGDVTVRASPRGGDSDTPACGGATAPAGSGANRPGVGARGGVGWVGGWRWWGWRGGERRHLARCPASLRTDRRGGLGRWRSGRALTPTPGRAPEVEVGGRCPLGDRSRRRLQGCACTRSRMERGWSLAWSDERRGDVGGGRDGQFGVAVPAEAAGRAGLGDLPARAPRVVVRIEFLGGPWPLQRKSTPVIVQCLGEELTS